MPPNSSQEARTRCRQARRKAEKGKETRRFREKSAPDVQTYFPSGSLESRWGGLATPRETKVTLISGHTHTHVGTEGPYGRLVLWGVFLGA